MSSKDSPHVDEAAVTRWDRPRWISVFSSHNPTIREVTECLGLGLSASSSTTNRGIPKFDNPDYRKLSSEVTRLSKELPKERDALLDFAADPSSLDAELEELLATYGPAIWGRETDRTCLLTPDPAKKTYTKDLFFEDPDDKDILKIHLQRWIIIKACYYIRNMKLKRSSAANDYDTLADMEGDDLLSPSKPHLVLKLPHAPSKLPRILISPQSPNGTPISLSPSAEGRSTTAGAEPSSKPPVNIKKRKSSVFNSLSDGEDMGSPPVKRPYQSHTMLKSRNSPRKSLQSIAGSPVSENTPPPATLGQSPLNGLQAKAASTSTPEVGRALLTPLSSNDLNGTARPPNSAPPTSGFTAVNTGSFTPVNTSPPSKELRPLTSAPLTSQNYASPYEAKSRSTPPTQSAQNPPRAPPLSTAVAGQGFQAINSPVVTNGVNGVSAQNSPNLHPNPPILHSSHQLPAPTSAGPTSRSNTPVHIHHHHHHRPSIAQQRSSRSNTPIAPASSAPPVQPAQPVSNHSLQLTSAPAVQSVASSHAAPSITRIQHIAAHTVPHDPGAVYYAPPIQAVLKSHPFEASPASAAVQHAMNPTDLNALQCEVLGLLTQYLFPRPASPPDETVVLHKTETLWNVGAAFFRQQIGPLYELETKVLQSWIHERRMLAHLRHAIASKPGVATAEMVDRLLAMNDLRMMRLKWKNMSSVEGLSAEDLLCRTISIMTNTEGAEYMFKDALNRISDEIFEYMRREDMRILIHKR